MKQLAALFLFLFLICLGGAEPAHANCTAPCTKAQLATDIATNWPDNTVAAITPALLRSTVLGIVNSYLDIAGAPSFTCTTHQFLVAIATLSTYICAQPAFSDISGAIAPATQLPDPLTIANVAAPASPAAGNVTIWPDSTDLRFHDKNAAGVIGTTAVSVVATANTFLTGMSAAGVFTTATAVTSLTPAAGLVSATTAGCSQTAVTTTGTLSRGDCINPQVGTSYAIADSDRGKIILGSNAAAQAYSIAQAATAGAFFPGWTTFIENNSTNVAGVITITPATTQICAQGVCGSSYKIQPGQFARLSVDPSNVYQITENTQGGQLPGTITNDAANAGNVGEYISSTVAVGSAISVSTGVQANLTSITLTPGDWDVTGIVDFVTTTTTSVTLAAASLSTTTGTIDDTNGHADRRYMNATVPGSGTTFTPTPMVSRFSVSTNTTVFLVLQSNFTASTMTAYGVLRARRVR